MRVTKEVKDAVQTVVDDLNKSNAKGGEISLDEICKKLPNANRWEVVSALRHVSDGIFVTGRRGLKSRFMYGEAAKPMAKSIKYRQDYRAKNTRGSSEQETRNGAHPAPSHPAAVSQSFALRIGIGDQSTTIPISIEMVPAGA